MSKVLAEKTAPNQTQQGAWGVRRLTLRLLPQVTIDVCVFAFDLLYADGEPLIHLPLRLRRERLAAALPNLEPSHIQLARSIEISPDPPSGTAQDLPPAPSGHLSPSTAHPEAAAICDSTSGNPKSYGASDVPARPAAAAANSKEADVSGPAPAAAAVAPDLPGVSDPALAAAGAKFSGAPRVPSGDLVGSDSRALPGGMEEAVGFQEGVLGEGPEAGLGGSPAEQVEGFLLEAFASGAEGLMLKALDQGAAYQPSKRSDSWVKLKRWVCSTLTFLGCCSPSVWR